MDLHNPSPIRKRRKRGQARRGQRGRRPQLQVSAVVAVVAGIAPRTGKAIRVLAISGAADVGEYGACGDVSRHLLKVGVHAAVVLRCLARFIPRVSSLATIGATVSALTVKKRVPSLPLAVHALIVRAVEFLSLLVELTTRADDVRNHIKVPHPFCLRRTDRLCPRLKLGINVVVIAPIAPEAARQFNFEILRYAPQITAGWKTHPVPFFISRSGSTAIQAH